MGDDSSRPDSRVPLLHLDVDVSISIVTWNNSADIVACLDALPAAAGSVSFAVTVLDNASTDDTVARIAATHPEVRVIQSPSNTGFGAGHNRAMQQGVGWKHLVLNPDTVPLSGSLEALCRFLDEHPRTAFVGPRIYEKDGRIYPSCRAFPTPGALIFRNKLLARLFPRNPYTLEYLMGDRDHSQAMDVGWLSGSVLLTSRAALEEIGLLDERFFMYCEDMDWCRRAHNLGWRVSYAPEASVIHLRARSTDQRIPAMILEHHRSMWKYFRKHEESRRPVWWSAGLAALLIARAGILISQHYLKKLIRLSP